jgi:hypothetical protein
MSGGMVSIEISRPKTCLDEPTTSYIEQNPMVVIGLNRMKSRRVPAQKVSPAKRPEGLWPALE